MHCHVYMRSIVVVVGEEQHRQTEPWFIAEVLDNSYLEGRVSDLQDAVCLVRKFKVARGSLKRFVETDLSECVDAKRLALKLEKNSFKEIAIRHSGRLEIQQHMRRWMLSDEAYKTIEDLECFNVISALSS